MGALTEEQAVNNLGVLLDRIELAGAYIWTVMDKYRDGTLAGARRGQVANLCDVTYINAMKDHVHRLFEESHDDATRIINDTHMEADMQEAYRKDVEAERDDLLSRLQRLEAAVKSQSDDGDDAWDACNALTELYDRTAELEVAREELAKVRGEVDTLCDLRDRVAMMVPVGQETGTPEDAIESYIATLIKDRDALVTMKTPSVDGLKAARDKAPRCRTCQVYADGKDAIAEASEPTMGRKCECNPAGLICSPDYRCDNPEMCHAAQPGDGES